MADTLLDDLFDWLRIPSISTGEGDPADLERAAEWAAAKVRQAGGTVDLVRLDGRAPLVVGDLRAAGGCARSCGRASRRPPRPSARRGRACAPATRRWPTSAPCPSTPRPGRSSTS